MPDKPLSCTLTILNRKGLHARASAQLSELASTFDADTTVIYQKKTAPADSILNLLMLGAGYGSQIHIESTGPESPQAMAAITDLILSKFGESS